MRVPLATIPCPRWIDGAPAWLRWSLHSPQRILPPLGRPLDASCVAESETLQASLLCPVGTCLHVWPSPPSPLDSSDDQPWTALSQPRPSKPSKPCRPAQASSVRIQHCLANRTCLAWLVRCELAYLHRPTVCRLDPHFAEEHFGLVPRSSLHQCQKRSTRPDINPHWKSQT